METIKINVSTKKKTNISVNATGYQGMYYIKGDKGDPAAIVLDGTVYTPDGLGVIELPPYPTTLPAQDVYPWAKEKEKPTYKANEIDGFDTVILEHNASITAHEDIRALIRNIQTLLQSDDQTLDEIQEIVSYIKANRELVDSITIDKVNVADIVDDLVHEDSDKPLSARMGKALKALIDGLVPPDVDGDISVHNSSNTAHMDIRQEILDIETSVNIVDVVLTKAALTAYNTTKLHENDIIKVITDESQGGNESFYKWVKISQNSYAWQLYITIPKLQSSIPDTEKYLNRELWESLKGYHIIVDTSVSNKITERLYKTSGNALVATLQTVKNADNTITRTTTVGSTVVTANISKSSNALTIQIT